MKLPRKYLAMCCCLIAVITLVYYKGLSHFLQQTFLRSSGRVDIILSTSTPLIRDVNTTIQQDKTIHKDKTTRDITSLQSVREVQQDKTTTLPDKTRPKDSVAASRPSYTSLDFSGGKRHLEGLAAALKKNSRDNLVVVATTDYGYVEMTLNLYETSFERIGIDNYLIVCTHERAALYLGSRGIKTFLIQNDSSSVNSSYYGTANYSPKTHIKAEVTLIGLQAGLSVVMVDLDVYFFRNPIPYLLQPKFQEYDILMRQVYTWYNTGFYLAKPRPGLTEVFNWTMTYIYKRPRTREHDQQIWNGMLNKRLERENGSVRVFPLDSKLFPIGSNYFIRGRHFAGDKPCDECYVVHNNIIMGYEFKRYRFKEHAMWSVDNDGYYSNPSQRFMTYENTPRDSYLHQRALLMTAFKLSRVLNRVLILPAFYCKDIRCCFTDRFKGAIFGLDEHFYGTYREHVFLQHPKVPKSVKQSQSSIIDVQQLLTSAGSDVVNTGSVNSTSSGSTNSNVNGNATLHYDSGNVSELTEKLRKFEAHSVIHLSNLRFLDLTLDRTYEDLLNSTIAEVKYRPKK